MSYNASGLTDFIQENVELIIMKTVLGMNTSKNVTVVPGVKSATKLTELDPDATLQGGACGWNPLGTTTLTNRTLTVAELMNQESLCTKDLERKFLQLEVTAGTIAGSESMPIEEKYISQKIAKIQKKIDILMWQGDTISGNPDLDKHDGYIKIMTADVPGANVIARTASVYDDIEELLETLPEDSFDAENLIVYLSPVNYRKAVRELINKNLFHQTVEENAEKTFMFPGVDVKVVAISGMSGINNIVLASMSNLFMGTDLEGDFEEVSFHYSIDNRDWRFHMNWRQGAQIGIPAEIVMAA